EWLRVNSLPGEQLKRMASSGIRLGVDDFGSGYSNFGYLTELPIHTLKLDKSLIDDISEDQRALLKVQAIVGLAHDLGYDCGVALAAEGGLRLASRYSAEALGREMRLPDL
ncbi:EAL domain-containing protein, partial [Pseudomonas syringae group genomosp. 7]|uniref:EAL domain-containing protein n=1 Tax=Pseudomonas syringae group genomosp. 7 TaxID=251699 RepID=UPI00376FBAF6